MWAFSYAHICFELLDKQGSFSKAWNGIITLQEWCLWNIHLGFYQMRVTDIITLRCLKHYISHLSRSCWTFQWCWSCNLCSPNIWRSHCEQDKARLSRNCLSMLPNSASLSHPTHMQPLSFSTCLVWHFYSKLTSKSFQSKTSCNFFKGQIVLHLWTYSSWFLHNPLCSLCDFHKQTIQPEYSSLFENVGMWHTSDFI